MKAKVTDLVLYNNEQWRVISDKEEKLIIRGECATQGPDITLPIDHEFEKVMHYDVWLLIVRSDLLVNKKWK